MAEESGIVQAFILDGNGGGKHLNNEWSEVKQWRKEQGILWLHLDYTIPKVQQWLKTESGLEPLIVEALVAEETRPRCIIEENELMVLLRGVNLNPGEDPEDMVSIRVWLDPYRIITTRRRRILSIVDIRLTIEAGHGPKSTIDFLNALNDRLTLRMHSVVEKLSEQIDELEDNFLTNAPDDHRFQIMKIRQMAVMLRRYLNPQQEAIHNLQISHCIMLDEIHLDHFREAGDQLKRYIEELDSTRERATILQEEIMSRSVDLTNQRMYSLAVVSLIFLPLAFINGLLGINVGGIPGATSPWAFHVVTLLSVFIGVVIYFYLKHKKWV